MRYLCYLGLGGNLTNELGTPTEHIYSAVDKLSAHERVENVRLSSLYASKPMGPQDQPDFINAVVQLETDLSPYDLLALCQKLEQEAQRVRKRHWGERSLDVDILLYGNKRISSSTLNIPHKGIKSRNFVLIPLMELSPDITVDGELISDVPMSQDWTGLRKLKS